MALQQLYFLDLWRLTKIKCITMSPSTISKSQIQILKSHFGTLEWYQLSMSTRERTSRVVLLSPLKWLVILTGWAEKQSVG